MKTTKLAMALGSIAAVLTVLLTLLFSEAGETKYRVRIAATYSMSSRIDVWAQGFMDKNPHYSVVVMGTITNSAINMLLDRTVELCLSGRRLSDAERRTARLQQA